MFEKHISAVQPPCNTYTTWSCKCYTMIGYEKYWIWTEVSDALDTIGFSDTMAHSRCAGTAFMGI